MPRKVHAYSMGLVPYSQAMDLQNRLVDRRKDDHIADTLLLLSHPHVITLGRPQSERFLRYPASELARKGYPVVQAGRGGEVTYHGPDQLVLYPIIKLEEAERDLHAYLRNLEEVSLRVCRSLGVEGERVRGRTGVWAADRKVAAIGVRARHWVTYHGTALNIGRDLKGFDLIVPCGIADAEATSLEDLTGGSVSRARVEELVLEHFAEVFAREVEIKSAESLWTLLNTEDSRP